MNSKKFALAAVALACAAGAHAASQQTLSYTGDPSFTAAWIVDWNAANHTARLVEYLGASSGTYTDDGTLRVLTLATPIVTTQTTGDCNGLPMTQSVELRQLAVRHVSGGLHKGGAQLIEIGSTTDQGGCTPGWVTPYGSTSDAGTTTSYLDMDDRPSMDDLGHGATLAGMSDTDPTGLSDSVQLAARTVTFAHRAVTFSNSGAAVPRDVVDGWFVLDFGTFQRGYTRLSVDPHTHAEIWLGAAWSNGAPASIFQTLMVQPNAAAGFGGHNAQAHVWDSGLFLKSDYRTDLALYTDGTGAFEQREADATLDATTPARWAAVGANLVISRSNNPTSYYYLRTWVPIANYGKAHFVFESEDSHNLDVGIVSPHIVQRVNFYVDEGKATPPVVAPTLKVLARKTAPESANGVRP
ncbi:MAG: hypothetical protein ABIR54_00245 [Burkholderiaceae bacterium]